MTNSKSFAEIIKEIKEANERKDRLTVKNTLSLFYKESEGYKTLPTELLLNISKTEFFELLNGYYDNYMKNMNLVLVAATKNERTLKFVKMWFASQGNSIGIEFFIMLKERSGTSKEREEIYKDLLNILPEYMRNVLERSCSVR